MPYCEPHRPARDRIIDLEIMKLELRNSSRPDAPVPGREARTIARRATSPRQAG